jgi:hypothetical protein
MIFISVIVISLASVPFLIEKSEGFGECAQDCQSCHKIVKSEASCILDCVDLKDDNIKNITMVPTAGLWKVEVDKEGKTSTYFIDFGKKNVFVGEMRPATPHETHTNPEWEGNDTESLLNDRQSKELTDILLGPDSNKPKQ